MFGFDFIFCILMYLFDIWIFMDYVLVFVPK